MGAAAPAVAASCGGVPLSMLYGDFGTVTNPIISYTGSASTGCNTSQGTTWTLTTFRSTITNTSLTKTISNLQIPVPYVTLANTQNGCTTPAVEQVTAGLFSTPLTGFPAGPTTGRDVIIGPGSPGTEAYVPWSTYAGIIPTAISGTGRNGVPPICTGLTAVAPAIVPVYYPPLRTLAPGQSTSFTMVAWTEAPCPNETFNLYFPDFVLGSVC